MLSKKLEDYKSKMIQFLKRSFPDKSEEEIESKLEDIIDERDYQDDNITVQVKYFDQINDDKYPSINALERSLDKAKPVITKYGTTYIQHSVKEALESKMLDATGKRRKAAKAKKFEHINDEDPTIMKRYDAIQQTYKASVMNSYYGVLTANGSIFRDLDCGESVTSSGEEIIMTAIDTFEKFLRNNFHLYDPSDVVTYIENILNEEYESEIEFEGISKDCLIDWFNDHFYDRDELYKIQLDLRDNEAIMNYIDNLSQEEINKVYYKNNLYEFLTDSELIKNFEDIFNNEEPFLDPNNPSEENKEILEDIWFYVKDWVFYNHIDINKYNYCKKGKRKSVLTVDTDSNFLYLKPAYEYFKNSIDKVDDSNEMIISSINCITYLITKVINEAYLRFGELHNVEEKYRPLINMKNEFMLSRLLLTKNKKSYASSVLMQEGRLIKKQKIDLKGLAIKKSNTNKFVSEYFTNILKDDIILAKEINYSNIIRKYFNLIDVIKNSFNKGEITFTLPSRANEIGSYAIPANVMQVRGVLTWNTLFPEDEITLPTNVNVVKVIIEEDYDLIRETILDYAIKNDITIDDEELEVFLNRISEAFDLSYKDKDNNSKKLLVKDGIINVISIPKTVTEIPVFIRPFLNIDNMVFDHLNSGVIILDCLNIQTPKINDNLIPTNIIKI
jgi:hypothetical protein